MGQIKLLVFDVDDTLVPRSMTSMLPSTKEILTECQKQGIKVLIATGRCWYFVSPQVFKDLPSDYYVTINGQCILDKNFNIIQSHRLTEDEMNQLVDASIENNVAIAFKFNNAMVTYNMYKEFVDVYNKGVERPDVLFDGSDTKDYHKKHDLAMGAFLIGDDNDLERIAESIPDLAWVTAYKNAKETFRPEYNKATAIEEVLDYLNLTWDNVMAFGDADNDVEMIQKAAIGVAMGNACDYAKANADYVTADCKEDGIAQVIRHFNVI